jgi:hypothetical protein
MRSPTKAHRCILAREAAEKGIEAGTAPGLEGVEFKAISLSLPVGPAADYHSMIEVSNAPVAAVKQILEIGGGPMTQSDFPGLSALSRRTA